ncbi:MAG: hypothetical protein AAF604_20205 [Acidobacteriota bacterium]
MIALALLLYAAATLYLGWRAGRGDPGGEAFWNAGRNLGAGSVGLSISAGFMSISWSCVYAAQLFYGYGLGALWLITVPWLLSLGGIYLLARRYRALPAFSQPEMVGERFGVPARRAVACAIAAVFLIWGGAEIYVAASLLAPGLGLPVSLVIAVITLLVAIYASVGGLRAVVATDKLQYGVVAIYVVLVALVAASALARNPDVGWPGAELLAPSSGRPWNDLFSPGLAVILLTFVAYLPGWLFETDLWVRVQAARDGRAARRGTLLAMLNATFFVGLLPLFIGLAALVLFPPVEGQAPAFLGNDGDAIFATFIDAYAPIWLRAIATVGLVAAAMSTIDTCANVMALSLGYDLMALRRRRSSRRLTLVVLIACGVFALFTESLWDLFYLSAGILTTAVAFPVAAVFLPWARRTAVTTSSIAGFAGTVAAYFLETRGFLAAVEPTWLADSGLGYILWGILSAVVGYAVGAGRRD